MEHHEFRVGETFYSGDKQYRCTDIGKRTIAAIRIDTVDVHHTTPGKSKVLNFVEADSEGWFNGPPYAVAEILFDEDDIISCTREFDSSD